MALRPLPDQTLAVTRAVGPLIPTASQAKLGGKAVPSAGRRAVGRNRLPEPESREYMRRHVKSVGYRRCDLGVTTRSVQCFFRHLWRVVGMNRVVKDTGVARKRWGKEDQGGRRRRCALLSSARGRKRGSKRKHGGGFRGGIDHRSEGHHVSRKRARFPKAAGRSPVLKGSSAILQARTPSARPQVCLSVCEHGLAGPVPQPRAGSRSLARPQTEDQGNLAGNA